MRGQNKTSQASDKVNARKQLLGGELALCSEKQCPEARIGSTKTILLSGQKIKQGTEKHNCGTHL